MPSPKNQPSFIPLNQARKQNIAFRWDLNKNLTSSRSLVESLVGRVVYWTISVITFGRIGHGARFVLILNFDFVASSLPTCRLEVKR